MENKRFGDKTQWLLKPLNDFCNEVLYLICAMLVIRTAEAIALFATGYQAELIVNNLIGFAIDLAHIGWIVAIIYLPYAVLCLVSKKAANITVRTIFAAYLCISMILVGYFATTHIPLDSIINAYSPHELYVTITANSPYNIPIAIAIIIASLLFAAIPRKKLQLPRWLQITMMAIMALCIFVPSLEKNKFRYDREYYIIENKTHYLWNSLRSNQSVIQYTESELKGKAEEFESFFPEYEFIDYHYPFLHKDKTADILSPFLADNGQKPNIVIIIVEGLSNYISGRNSTLASATPFLDSLSEHALVWENCLSTSERTFGVLPSLLGALPFGDRGFMAYRHDIPKFSTLATILHDNGYKNTFFYGGWYGFDNMDIFARNNYMEMYYDKPEYKSAEQQNEWGLLDEYMLLNSFDDLTESTDSQRLDIYLTLTTHDPFNYPDHEKYIKQYEALPKKGESISSTKSNASFLYADNCLRKFFDKYRNYKSFANTIFVITGDHRFVTENNSETIDNFQVPLIIWSPMLTCTRHFPALTTHRNLSPALLAYLEQKHGIKTSQEVVWLNSGLDTSNYIATNTFSPHFDAGRKIKGITYNGYFITTEKTFRFDTADNTLKTRPFNGKTDKSELLRLYIQLENYIMKNDALLK